MGHQNLSDAEMKILIRHATALPTAGSQTRTRIVSGIAEYTEKKASRHNPFLAVIYNPAFSLVFLIPLLIPVFISVFFLFQKPAGGTWEKAILISGSAISDTPGTAGFRAGSVIEEGERVTVPDGVTSDFGMGDNIRFRLFPGTDFKVVTGSEASGRYLVSFSRGSAYVVKHGKLDDNKSLGVRVNGYTFMLTGTRALFQSAGQHIRVFCFEGRIDAFRLEEGDERELFTLRSGEEAHIVVQRERRTYSIDDFLIEAAVKFDKTFDVLPPVDDAMLSRHEGFLAMEGVIGLSVSREETGPIPATTPLPEPARDAEKKPFTVHEAGNISDASFRKGRINFIAAVPDEGSGYIITQNSIYGLNGGTLRKGPSFPAGTIFRVKPAVSKTTICCVSTGKVYILDRYSLAVREEMSLPPSGSAEDNYYPAGDGGTYYIPVLNHGYYTIERDEREPELRKVYDELFPVSPLVTKAGIVVGASYENYIAMISRGGSLLWKNELEGKSFVNFIDSGGIIYAYVLKDSCPMIIGFDSGGRKRGEWPLGQMVTADLTAFGTFLFGYYDDGGLFMFDTASGTAEHIADVFGGTLSGRILRTMKPTVHDGRLYSGTDKGELLVYNIAARTVEYRYPINVEEAFFASPIVRDATVYLAGNSGKVYEIVKTER
ncbi:MAG: hypothetical protein JW881_09015 [Spirochaetales bacterium]|nr:hypothetical protein [Spirochaetales bacterium]